MRLAIMQPYFFPYLGYFALAASVDRFVFLDDAQFIKQGWINRNRWWVGGKPDYFTVPVTGVGERTPIDEVGVVTAGPWRRKLLTSLDQHYAHAPHRSDAMALLREVIELDAPGIAAMAKQSVRSTCQRLGIAPSFVDSTRGYANGHLRGEERVLDICRHEGATEYVNLPGGMSLYDPARFADIGVSLRFIHPWRRAWPRGPWPEDPTLSVIDALAFQPAAALRNLIEQEMAA